MVETRGALEIQFSWAFQLRDPADTEGRVKTEFRVIGRNEEEAANKLRLTGVTRAMQGDLVMVTELSERPFNIERERNEILRELVAQLKVANE